MKNVLDRFLHRFRTLPIRSRLAMLVAAAVAFGVAAVSVTCWFIVQGKLYEQVDADLRQMAQPQHTDDVVEFLQACPQTVDSTQSDTTDPSGFNGLRTQTTYLQLVKSSGKFCVSSGSAGVVKVAGADTDVIKDASTLTSLPSTLKQVFRNGVDSKGNAVRVLTTPLLVKQGPTLPQLYPDTALVVAVPLKSTQNTLNELALVLLVVSGIGVVGAGAAGLAVARAGLRPVDKLTEAVEHVARTEDLAIRIPVDEDSDDEIARLSRSFNSMTTSLANSRELQQQLIADAGHELRTPLTSLRTNVELLTRSEETGRPIPRPTARRSSPR